MRPQVELNPVHPRTESIWPLDLHRKLILSILNSRPLCSCRTQATGRADTAMVSRGLNMQLFACGACPWRRSDAQC